jgi:hypothetical protein
MSAVTDPSALMLSIRSGALDDRLDEISRWLKLRREVIAASKAAEIEPGDKFTIKDISPQYMAGALVEVTGFDEPWIVTNVCSYNGGRKYPFGSTLRLRRSHIGDIFKKED